MSRIVEAFEVDVPVKVAYEQWALFESYPRFMEGVDRVIQVNDTTLDWTATIAGRAKHWLAEIVERRPNEVIAWRSIEGARNDGTVRFEPIARARTRLTLELDVEPEGPRERAGDALGVVERRVRGDLARFRDFVEARGRATGPWGSVAADRREDPRRGAGS